jgi:hypothetical protein
MASLSATIANYVANGILSPQQAQALNAQLRAAAAAIAADRPGAAGILQGFSQHVQALVGSGMLQLIHAQVLLDTAAAAVAQL